MNCYAKKKRVKRLTCNYIPMDVDNHRFCSQDMRDRCHNFLPANQLYNDIRPASYNIHAIGYTFWRKLLQMRKWNWKKKNVSFRNNKRDFRCLRMWHKMPIHPGWHLHSNGLVHEPCWHPGSTWHSLQVGPAQPRRQRHSLGISQ